MAESEATFLLTYLRAINQSE